MLAKLTRKPLGIEMQIELIQKALDLILSLTSPKQLSVFGSAGRLEMTDFSDLDFALIYASAPAVKIARSSGIFAIS